MFSNNLFQFGTPSATANAYQARIPANIKSVTVLMDVLYERLHLPDYFGSNWNALDECLSDLKWLPPGEVLLQHDDLPLIDDTKSLSIYLAVLNDAIKYWQKAGVRRFSVVFPREHEHTVRQILSKV